ncbi:hypothetical protein TruAng_012204 [Truncatella angustata]|nr:hypothetical protein TruAng_012204 [Truncatella angustata]
MTQSSDAERIYLLERHEKELQRLTAQHDFIKLNTQDHLLAPQLLSGQKNLKVLDSGCADGLWLRELAERLSGQEPQLHGVDISPALYPSKESQVTSNIDLRVHNISQPFPSDWHWENSFDIIHQRLLIWGIQVPQWPAVLRNHFQILKPGGYIQLAEVEWIPQGGFPDDRPQLQRMGKLQTWFSEKNGMDFDITRKLGGLLKDVGFESVDTLDFPLNYGSLAPPEWRTPSSKFSTEVFAGLANRMDGKSIPGVASTPEEFLAFLGELKDDIYKFGYQPRISFVFGRKPAI